MGEKYTEGSIIQHLAKLRKLMEQAANDPDNAHLELLVPPTVKRGAASKAPSVAYANAKANIQKKRKATTMIKASEITDIPQPPKPGMLKSEDDEDDDATIKSEEESSDTEFVLVENKTKKPKVTKPKKATNKGKAPDSLNLYKKAESPKPTSPKGKAVDWFDDDSSSSSPLMKTRGNKVDYGALQGGDSEDESGFVDYEEVEKQTKAKPAARKSVVPTARSRSQADVKKALPVRGTKHTSDPFYEARGAADMPTLEEQMAEYHKLNVWQAPYFVVINTDLSLAQRRLHGRHRLPSWPGSHLR